MITKARCEYSLFGADGKPIHLGDLACYKLGNSEKSKVGRVYGFHVNKDGGCSLRFSNSPKTYVSLTRCTVVELDEFEQFIAKEFKMSNIEDIKSTATALRDKFRAEQIEKAASLGNEPVLGGDELFDSTVDDEPIGEIEVSHGDDD